MEAYFLPEVKFRIGLYFRTERKPCAFVFSLTHVFQSTKSNMKLLTLANLSLLVLGAVASEPTVYLIRHGEKPINGSTGLSEQGDERAQCLTSVFGPNSEYNIGYIMAEKPKSGNFSFYSAVFL